MVDQHVSSAQFQRETLEAMENLRAVIVRHLEQGVIVISPAASLAPEQVAAAVNASVAGLRAT